MSALLTSGLALDIHASHQAGGSPRLKLAAAANVRARLDAHATATALLGLSLGVTATGALASATTGDAATILSGTATVLADVRAVIRAGANVTLALATGGGVGIPNVNVAAAATALLDAEGALTIHPNLTVRASIPVLQGLANLAVTANERGLAWDVGVMLPFASGIALGGSVTGDLAGARRAWATLGWAYQREITR